MSYFGDFRPVMKLSERPDWIAFLALSAPQSDPLDRRPASPAARVRPRDRVIHTASSAQDLIRGLTRRPTVLSRVEPQFPRVPYWPGSVPMVYLEDYAGRV